MHLAVACVLWVVTAWRLPSARQEPWKRALWAAFAFAALALTCGLPQVAAAVDREAGVAGLSALAVRLAGVIACAAMLEWVSALTPAAHSRPARRVPARRVLAVAVMAVLIVLFLAIRPRQAASLAGAMAGNRGAAAWLLVFEAWLGMTMALATVQFARAASLARAGLLGWGLRLLTAGTGLTVAFAAARSVMLMVAMTGSADRGGTGAAAGVTGQAEYVAILLIAAGTSLPALAVAARTARDYRALHALRPLWAQLTAAAPQVILGAAPSRRDDVRAAGADLRSRLGRRTVEIRDAALLLRAHVSDADAAAARALLAGAGLSGAVLDAAAEAAWLRAAVAARTLGLPAVSPPPARPLRGGADVSAEARWLRQVSAAWSDPAVRRAAAAITPAGATGGRR